MKYCKRGHPWNQENTYGNGGAGKRKCRACRTRLQQEQRDSYGPRVPVKHLQPILARYQLETGRSVYDLEAAGAPLSVLSKVSAGKPGAVTAESADKILAAMDATYLWHTLLSEFYPNEAA